MRLSAVVVAGLTLGARAAYFSEGWTPGQPTPTLQAPPRGTDDAIPTAPTPAPTPAAKWSWKEFSSKHLDLGKLVTEGPVASALSGMSMD